MNESLFANMLVADYIDVTTDDVLIGVSFDDIYGVNEAHSYISPFGCNVRFEMYVTDFQDVMKGGVNATMVFTQSGYVLRHNTYIVVATPIDKPDPDNWTEDFFDARTGQKVYSHQYRMIGDGFGGKIIKDRGVVTTSTPVIDPKLVLQFASLFKKKLATHQ